MRCCTLYSGPELDDQDGCLKEDGHNDNHVFRAPDGKLIAWEDDYTCDCGCWDTYEGDGDACQIYGEVSSIYQQWP